MEPENHTAVTWGSHKAEIQRSRWTLPPHIQVATSAPTPPLENLEPLRPWSQELGCENQFFPALGRQAVTAPRGGLRGDTATSRAAGWLLGRGLPPTNRKASGHNVDA